MKNLLLFALTIFLCQCKEKRTLPDCGCESETLFTIPDNNYSVPEEEQMEGILFYKTAEKTDRFYNDEQYNNRFWIIQGSKNCYNCKRHFIICNENIVSSDYNFLKNSSDSVIIKFRGEAKLMCVPKIVIADYEYKEIVITLLEKKH